MYTQRLINKHFFLKSVNSFLKIEYMFDLSAPVASQYAPILQQAKAFPNS